MFNNVLDCIFLLDIIVTFNSAIQDEHFKEIDCRKTIACNYIRSWFFIDTVAILPFDLMLNSGRDNQVNSLIRFTRVGKLYKLIKITRLVRLLKVIKQQQKIMKKLNKMFNLGRGIEKLTFIVLIFLMVCHLMACIWIFIAEFEDPDGQTVNWISKFGFQNSSMSDIYCASLYYMVTTIATVGYGDISGTNTIERIICIFLMITGVFFFSFASGSLTHLITHRETEELKTVERLNILNKIYKDYNLGSELYYSVLYLIESENKET